MRMRHISRVLEAAAVLTVTAAAAGASEVRTFAVDSGGGGATCGTCCVESSIGGIGGVCSSAASVDILRSGYIGQLTEAARIEVTASPTETNEGAAVQLGGLLELDDSTVAVVEGSSVVWAAPAFPISSIGADGLAATAAVWSNTWGAVVGDYLGVSGSGAVLVLNSDADNCGIYACDGVPDDWQVKWFGPENPAGKGCEKNVTGRDNRSTYIADLNPTDPDSVFEIVAISNQPSGRVVCFGTTSTERVYRLEYVPKLDGSTWTNLPGAAWTTGQPGQMSLSDTNATAARFYRVHVKVN
jgi:hypothetical protein